MGRSPELRPVTKLDRMLPAFLDHPEVHFSEFNALARGFLVYQSRRRGAGLPADVCDEIVNETIVGLLEAAPGAFKPARGSALTFLAYHVGHAARRVRARYTPPGQQTRGPKKRPAADSNAEASVVTLPPPPDPEMLIALEASGLGGSQALTFGLARHVEASVQVGELLAFAPVRVRRALVGTYFKGDSLRETATKLGINHGTLSREISTFFDRARAAA